MENQGLVRQVRMFFNAIALQAMLSAASLLVGIILIRRTSDLQYGYYILISNAVLLLTTLQNAYIQPSLVIKLTSADATRDTRTELVGNLYHLQRMLVPIFAIIAIISTFALWSIDAIDTTDLIVVTTGCIAIVACLYREFFRMVLLAYRRPQDVLRSDTLFAALLIGGAFAATHSATPAAAAVSALALAAIVSGFFHSRSLKRHEAWQQGAKPKPVFLKEIAAFGLWSTAGAGIHWAFTQGYNYLVAAQLSVASIAALSATRLMIMPVNLLSTGIGSMMFPTVSTWMQQHSRQTVLRRLALFAAGLAAVASCYLAFMWMLRNWIFDHILHKQFTDRDPLLMLWSAICLLMVVRDLLVYVLAASGRFRILSTLTLISALFALLCSFIAMRQLGEIGALLGVLLGELFNVVGIIVLSPRDARNTPPVISS